MCTFMCFIVVVLDCCTHDSTCRSRRAIAEFSSRKQREALLCEACYAHGSTLLYNGRNVEK